MRTEGSIAAERETAGNWTTAMRERLARAVPPGQLLPDRQPSYVASWAYVFGVASLAAFLVVLASGGLLALKGVAWWHTSSIGHFVNSLHLWSVELFFFFMVIHLWAKFLMAAWRGRRALTWVTGAVAFLGSIGTAFTGYLSQTNFDSQWISTQAKDGLNSVGVGAFFNVLDTGQMLLWHVLLLPVTVGLLIAGHVLLVRRHGVVPPFDADPGQPFAVGRSPEMDIAPVTVPPPAPPVRRPRTTRHTAREHVMTAPAAAPAAAPARGRRPESTPDSHRFPTRSYDLVKEFVIAMVAVTLLTVALAAVFSSPDEKPITLSRWASGAPADVVATAATELAGTSTSATYGAPYNAGSDGQKLGPLPLQRWAGKRIPVDSANDLVLTPLRQVSGSPQLAAALDQWDHAAPGHQATWSNAYSDALTKAPDGDPAQVPPGSYGPVPVLAAQFLDLARSGGLEGMLASSSNFYGGNATKPLLLLADGAFAEDQARAQHLAGDQWGMMNETGKYPGQPWMWLYSFWYQIKPFSTSGNADALVWGLMMVLSIGFVLIPFLPGVRSLPRRLGIYKLIWRDWYTTHPPSSSARSHPGG